MDLQEAAPTSALADSQCSNRIHYDFLFIHRLPLVQKSVTITHSVLEATKGAEAVVIATEWPEFKKVDWAAVYAQMSKPAFVFDGRLIIDAAELRKIGFRVSFCYRRISVCSTDSLRHSRYSRSVAASLLTFSKYVVLVY